MDERFFSLSRLYVKMWQREYLNLREIDRLHSTTARTTPFLRFTKHWLPLSENSIFSPHSFGYLWCIRIDIAMNSLARPGHENQIPLEDISMQQTSERNFFKREQNVFVKCKYKYKCAFNTLQSNIEIALKRKTKKLVENCAHRIALPKIMVNISIENISSIKSFVCIHLLCIFFEKFVSDALAPRCNVGMSMMRKKCHTNIWMFAFICAHLASLVHNYFLFFWNVCVATILECNICTNTNPIIAFALQ